MPMRNDFSVKSWGLPEKEKRVVCAVLCCAVRFYTFLLCVNARFTYSFIMFARECVNTFTLCTSGINYFFILSLTPCLLGGILTHTRNIMNINPHFMNNFFTNGNNDYRRTRILDRVICKSFCAVTPRRLALLWSVQHHN